jgi:hypothetical protein
MLLGAFAAGLVVCAVLASDLGTYAQNVSILSNVQKWEVGAAILSALIQVALTGALVGGLALLASHKVAGPMVRLVGALRGIVQGRLPDPVAFRRGDQVGKVEDEFNEVSRLIRVRHESAQTRLRRELDAPGGAERRAAARDLRERADELAALLADAAGSGSQGSEKL